MIRREHARPDVEPGTRFLPLRCRSTLDVDALPLIGWYLQRFAVAPSREAQARLSVMVSPSLASEGSGLPAGDRRMFVIGFADEVRPRTSVLRGCPGERPRGSGTVCRSRCRNCDAPWHRWYRSVPASASE